MMACEKSFKVLILTIGIPGSGKTTWARKYAAEHPFTYVVSTDELRKELTGVEQCVDPSQNEMIHEAARERVKNIFNNPASYRDTEHNCFCFGIEVIVDSTNVDVGEWIKYKQTTKPSLMFAKVFDVTPEQAYEQEKNRERYVPMSVLREKWDEYQKNKEHIPYFFNQVL